MSAPQTRKPFLDDPRNTSLCCWTIPPVSGTLALAAGFVMLTVSSKVAAVASFIMFALSASFSLGSIFSCFTSLEAGTTPREYFVATGRATVVGYSTFMQLLVQALAQAIARGISNARQIILEASSVGIHPDVLKMFKALRITLEKFCKQIHVDMKPTFFPLCDPAFL
ncbi:MAG: hypothetical protein AAGF04_04830 [Chlamydiota bacterium]